MTNKLVVIINSLKYQKLRKFNIRSEISCIKLQLPPEPLTRVLPPTDPRSLCPQLNLLNPPPEKIPGYATDVDRRAVLDVLEKKKISCLCRELKRGSPVVEAVA